VKFVCLDTWTFFEVFETIPPKMRNHVSLLAVVAAASLFLAEPLLPPAFG
jgi:hypothetical protein